MALVITGTGNGSLNNLALSANTGTIVDTARAGGVIQVVVGTTQTNVGNTTTSYVDTNLSASITPTSSSNKILVMVTQDVFHGRSSSGQGSGVRLVRDSTVIWTPPSDTNGPFLDYLPTTSHYWLFNLNYLDSPATTSSVTYKTQGRVYQTLNSGSFVAQPAPSGTSDPNTPAIITLMEVVA